MIFVNSLVFLSSLVNILLGLIIFLKNIKKIQNIYLGLFAFNISGWAFSIAMMTMTYNVIWPRFAFWFVSLAFVFFTLFIKEYLGFIVKFSLFYKVMINLLVIAGVFFSLISFSNTIIDNVIFVNDNQQYFQGVSLVLGNLYNYLLLYYVLNFFFILYLMLRGYKLINSGLMRSQMKFFFIGIMVFSLMALLTNLILPKFGIFNFNSLGPAFSIIMISFIMYAITRYRLMDIRLVVFRSLAFGLIIFVIAGIFAAISTVIASVFSDFAKIQSNIVSGVIVATLLTLFYQPLRKLIERSTNAFLYKKSYNPDALLNQITEVSSSILDLHQLLNSIAKSLDEAFHSQKLGIVLVDNDVKKLNVAYQSGFESAVAEKLAGYPNAVAILHQEVKRLGGLLVIDEMKTKYENGEFEPIDKELLLALYQNDIAVILPLHVKDQVVGIVVLGNKKSGDPYNSQDLNVLKIIGGQVAIAIENARLYDELKDFNIKLEEEVRRKTSQLRKANIELRRLDEAKSEFISIASHQLRTPLTVIKGYISMMQEGSFGEVPPKIMENLRKVYVSNERLIGLVENLLDISRIESGRQEFLWEKHQLEEIAEDVVDSLKQTAGDKGLNLILHKEKELTPLVLMDKNKIHEVVMNFIDNAIKYTPQGSIEVSVTSEKDAVKFCVKDTGKGIDPQIKNNLFKKFSRGRDSFRMHTEGVGLGLYVAKMIIDAHQGRIWAESEGVNNGSLFCFTIPLNYSPKTSLPKFGTKVK